MNEHGWVALVKGDGTVSLSGMYNEPIHLHDREHLYHFMALHNMCSFDIIIIDTIHQGLTYET